MYCDLVCEDSDEDSSSDSSDDYFELFLLDPCMFCPTKPSRRPSSSAPISTSTTASPFPQFPFQFMFRKLLAFLSL